METLSSITQFLANGNPVMVCFNSSPRQGYKVVIHRPEGDIEKKVSGPDHAQRVMGNITDGRFGED